MNRSPTHQSGVRPIKLFQKKLDGTGFEPVTPTMSKWCATNCANRPQAYIFYRAQLPQANGEKIRRHPDLNWGIEVLQTSALPLGYAATERAVWGGSVIVSYAAGSLFVKSRNPL
jgi:hypothetical protein